jgi:hypothetical protein
MNQDGREPTRPGGLSFIAQKINGMIEWTRGGYPTYLQQGGHIALVALHATHLSAPRMARILALLKGHGGRITDDDIRLAMRAVESHEPTQADLDRVRAELGSDH